MHHDEHNKMNIITRSMDKKPVYEVNIDFDDAAKAWRENKRVLKNGCFEYKPEPLKYNLRERENKTKEKTI